ncbi:hypothetical protein HD554DRAFT_2040923 [Boletus coccyginus]|nr:hypothetical protein HD554DRAFT_2040923 [Boletus coccyginus]
MSLTPFEDILTLGKASLADPAKLDAIKEVAELKIQLDGMSRSVPDDQDNLAEDQEMWCARWQKLLEQTPMAEQAVGSAAPGPVQESANELPTTESPSEEHESVSSAGQKRKRVSSQVVVDEEEDNGDDIIEVVVLKPSKAQTGSKTLKTKCGKSKGKAGKAKKDMALVADPKAKGKEKVQPRPVHNNARVVIPVHKAPVALSSQVEADLPDFLRFSPLPEPDSDHEDDDAMPRKKAKLADLAWDVAIETMKLALLTMWTKMHGMLGFLTKLQACAKVAETYISSQQLEIEEMEALLEEL